MGLSTFIGRRKNLIFLFFQFSCIYSLVGQPNTEFVDLFIGTSGDHGQLDPAATIPFGMVKLGPETVPGNHSGYNFQSNHFLGFSHSRLSGVGCRGAGGTLLVKPGIGHPDLKTFEVDKATETASPAYYRIQTEYTGIQCEFTANNYVGIHRYTCPASDSFYLALNPKFSHSAFIEAEIEYDENQHVKGALKAKNVCNFGAFTQFFDAHFSKPPSRVVEKDSVLYIFFETQEEEVIELYVGVSSISTEQAALDKKKSMHAMGFDEIRRQSLREWEKVLGVVRVDGEPEFKKLFYTHLYHSCLLPVNATSTDGRFRAADGNIYEAKDYTHYNGWSIWDTYRTKLPLLTLLFPNRAADIGRSIMDLYHYGQGLTGWSGEYESVPNVRKEHSLIVLLDMYRKGINKIEFKTIWPSIVKDIPNLPYQSPDNILETSYDYWSISEVAEIMQQNEVASHYRLLAQQYEHIWRQKFKTMSSQSDIMHGDGLYEGTLWQYRWSVPWQIEGMINMIGGSPVFTQQLATFFDNDLYNHGNQPDIQVPFLFNYSNTPWRTQEIVHKILRFPMVQAYGTHKKFDTPYHGRIYKATPDAYIPEMDDDAGTMSAWYVWAAIGLYPSCVGQPFYDISSPLFEQISFHIEGQSSLVIKTNFQHSEQKYIHSLRLDGEEYHRLQITHDQFINAGEIFFELSDQPNENFLKPIKK